MAEHYCYYCMNPSTDSPFCGYCGSPRQYQAPAHHLKPGTVLQGKYLIGKSLGEGGFGITYLGRDLTLDVTVAIKEYYPHNISNRNHDYTNLVTMSKGNHGMDLQQDMQRFLNEARSLARFSGNSGVVGVRDFFQENGTAYIVMEYLDGITLRNYLATNGPIPAATVLELMRPIMEALREIHDQNLIHRDVSPDNIMVLKNGQMKLLDFGAARKVGGEKSMSVVLKPGYAPAEQYYTKGRQGPWTDVYALCATMYKCITGNTPDESVQRTFGDDLKAPSELGCQISPAFDQAIMQGLRVNIADRIQNMDALLQAMSGVTPPQSAPISNLETAIRTAQEAPEPLEYTQTVGPEFSPVETFSMPAEITEKKPRSKKPLFILLAAVGAAAVVLCLILLLSGGSSRALGAKLPNDRALSKDCSSILQDHSIPGVVVSADLDGDVLNENNKTYTATCYVVVSNGNLESDYYISLRYEFSGGQWTLCDGTVIPK